ncbi:MAG TPA: glutamyl-tRNA reductase [Verrucomicrobiales bacterium]|nr:glutamyl-tRNA reductase [Verrucomicrobiales bacterium]
MVILCFGLSHATAPVEIRERVAVAAKDVPEAVRQLTATEGIPEAVVVSTCNRMEIYAVAGTPAAATRVDAWIRQRFGLTDTSAFFQHFQEDAARHLFSVVSGLDSMVLGETEIFGQVKDAYAAAQQSGGTARTLNKLFQHSFRVGKLVRNTTDIQRGSTSVGSVAVELAEKVFGDLKDSRVMLLGAGDMSRRCAQSLQSRGAKGIVVSNRSHDRAIELAAELSGHAIHFDAWPAEVAQVDVIISSTAAPHTVIHREQILPAIRRRRGRPLFIIDIAVPRDVEASVNDIDGVYLHDIDSLESIASETRAKREQEITRCLQIIDAQVKALPLFAQEVFPSHGAGNIRPVSNR